MVVAVAQRPAPGSGVPTYTRQADLLFCVNAGHGEFPRIVIAPGDAEEAYYHGGDSLNLAWKYQIPVIALFDKELTEGEETGEIDESRVKVEGGKIAESAGVDYKRYEITDDGISPMAFPGTKNTVVKATSYEHDEFGLTTEDAGETKAMQDKRFLKEGSIRADFKNYETVKVYGDEKSKNVIVFWGSTKGPVLEAAKYLDKPVKLVQVVWMEPMDTERVVAELDGAEKIIDVEANHNGQLAELIRQKTGIEITERILRYDSRPFEVMELASELNKKLS